MPDAIAGPSGYLTPSADRSPGERYTQTWQPSRNKFTQVYSQTRDSYAQVSPTLRESYAQTSPPSFSLFTGNSQGMALMGAAAITAVGSIIGSTVSAKQNRDTQLALMNKQMNFSKEMIPINLKAQEDLSSFTNNLNLHSSMDMAKFGQQLTFQAQDRNAEKLSQAGVSPVLAYTGFGGSFPIARTTRAVGMNTITPTLPGNPYNMNGPNSQTIGGTGI